MAQKYWFWQKATDTEWRPIYAESEQQAKNIRKQISKNPKIEGITPIRPTSDTDLPIMLKQVIKRGDNDA